MAQVGDPVALSVEDEAAYKAFVALEASGELKLPTASAGTEAATPTSAGKASKPGGRVKLLKTWIERQIVAQTGRACLSLGPLGRGPSISQAAVSLAHASACAVYVGCSGPSSSLAAPMDAPIHAAVVGVLGDFLLSPAARHHLESQGVELKPGLNGSGRS
jgi:hypothetical protein